MPRIAIAGFQHETNTFSDIPTTLADFEVADSWPPLLHGDEVITRTAGINLPIAGFAAACAGRADVDLVPILWCAAEPAGRVTDAAFEAVCDMLIEGLCAAGPLDGVYLDLHGAMVTDSFEDGESEVLRRVRSVLGEGIPIAVSLDLHANITPAMVERASYIAIFRSYPHLDMAETGARCLPPLLAMIAGSAVSKAFRQASYLIPLYAQFTGAEPCRSLYNAVEGASADIALGFTAADIPDCGPSLVAYGDSQQQADALADDLLSRLAAAEPAFDCRMMTPREAVRTAMAHPEPRPVVIADVQDNPGAGASSDSTGLLRALVKEGASGAILGLLHDPALAAAAHRSGRGARIEGALGGRSGISGDNPFDGIFDVEVLSEGNARFTGAMYGGGVAVLGPSAVLRVAGCDADVKVIVSSQRSQCLDLGLLTHFGLDPSKARILCVKSTVHYRADFEPIATSVLTVAAPGGFPCDLAAIPYRRLRRGVRRGPLRPI